MSGEQKKQREILIKNKSGEEKDPTYQERLAEWDVTLEDGIGEMEARFIAEHRLETPAKGLSSREIRHELSLEIDYDGRVVKDMIKAGPPGPVNNPWVF